MNLFFKGDVLEMFNQVGITKVFSDEMRRVKHGNDLIRIVRMSIKNVDTQEFKIDNGTITHSWEDGKTSFNLCYLDKNFNGLVIKVDKLSDGSFCISQRK